ncbi:TetR/AcrR family transcriptional regulator [Hyalangium sp.]|uniref:TetR/AcrR family transcriptional regulator n=1 Tax=Hyalangium sp. TaxID=2028555 RepID=UPI002D31C3B4|nr:TetR family transcriptional regulator [Hyalangium sp.]HYI00928.1 TetR family transcriptional regulator [Hyalangium sp.]
MSPSNENAAPQRAALTEAALTVFSKKGYAATSFEEIAVQAGLSRGVLYQHFKTKAELYITAIRDRWTEVSTPLWPHLQGEEAPLDRLRRFLVTWFTLLEQDARLRSLLEVVCFRAEHLPELAAGIEELRRHMEQWTEMLTALLESARSRGELGSSHAPRTAALAVLAYLQGVTASHLLSPSLFSPAADAEHLTRVLLHGVIRQKAE